MSLTYIRVVNEQLINRSILIDKIDRSQGNFEGYAQKAKQAVYVPYTNPSDSTVKGYLNLVPTDEVLLSANNGTIKGLMDSNHVTVAAIDSALLNKSTITAAAHNGGGSYTQVTGTTFLSLYPDVTRLQIKNLSGVVQTVPSGSFTVFTSTSIRVADGSVTIGTPGAGWQVRVQANSLLSDWFTL
jgi:hypothetical protein